MVPTTHSAVGPAQVLLHAHRERPHRLRIARPAARDALHRRRPCPQGHPEIGARHERLVAGDRHHASANCHLATLMVARIATCTRTGQPYEPRDVDGTPVTGAQGAPSSRIGTRSSPDDATSSRTSERVSASSKQAADQESRSRQALQHPSPPTQADQPSRGSASLRTSRRRHGGHCGCFYPILRRIGITAVACVPMETHATAITGIAAKPARKQPQ